MGYNIGSNFNVGSKIPLDSRTVVDFINDLDNIQNKYEGLIVYCKEDEKYYKYVNDTFEEFSNNLTDDYALKSYVGVKNVSGGTAENPLKITSLQSDLPVVIRGGYLAFNNPSDDDNYSITIHCITDSEPIIVLHTDVLYDAFDTGEPIEYVGDIVMLRNDIYGLYHYSIDAETGETTFTHNDGSNSDFNDETPSYTQIALNSTAATGLKNGLCKFEFTGRANVKGYSYNPIASELNGKYVPIQHLMGNLKILYSDNTATNIIPIDLFGREAESKTDANGETCTFASCYDIFTEKYLQRNWSDDFFIKDSFTYSNNILDEETIGNNGNVLHKFTIPASAFGDQLPKNDKSNLRAVSPMGFSRSYNWLKAYQSQCNSSQPYVSMTYNSEEDTYLVCFLTRNNVTTKSDLLKSKVYIKYELRNPIYDYHTFKIYAKNGMRIIFEKIPVTTNDNSVNNYIDASSNVYLVTQNVYAPTNKTAILEGFEQTTTNINDLNKRVDNIEITSSKIGVGDGTVDDHDAIQSLIDNANDNTVSKLVHEVKIPEGIYLLNSPLVIERSNIKLIGEGNVILKPSGNFPAIIVTKSTFFKVEDVSIENINIWLPDQAYSDDESNPYTYTSELNEIRIEKGRHSGIYIDGTNGLYRINISNVTIEGVYRTNIKDTDRSYGVIFSDGIDEFGSSNYCYFCTVNNLNTFSVYCGLYLDTNTSNAKITNFHWDSGANIYNHGGKIFATHGIGYGIYCKGRYNFIDYRGQASGGFERNGWCYEDQNKNKYSLSDIIGSSNVYTYTSNNDGTGEYFGDYFVDDYDIKDQLVYNDNGTNVDVFLVPQTLSECNVYCSGIMNYIIGHCFDPQRTDYYYYFTDTSKDNRYYYSTEDMSYGNHNDSNSDVVKFYESDINKSIDELDSIDNYYVFDRPNVQDLGTNNTCINKTNLQDKSFVGGIYINSGDDIETYAIADHFGMQDNVLSYIYENAKISVYQYIYDENSEYIFYKVPIYNLNNGVKEYVEDYLIKAFFNPTGEYKDSQGNVVKVGFNNNNTSLPKAVINSNTYSVTYNSPLFIDIEFNDDFKIDNLAKFGIKFNKNFAEDIQVQVLQDINPEVAYTDENGLAEFRASNYDVAVELVDSNNNAYSNVEVKYFRNKNVFNISFNNLISNVMPDLIANMNVYRVPHSNNPTYDTMYNESNGNPNAYIYCSVQNIGRIDKVYIRTLGTETIYSTLNKNSFNQQLWISSYGLLNRYNKTSYFTKTLYYKDRNGVSTINNVKGLRICFRKPYSTSNYNTNNDIGLSYIWATDGNSSGNTWLPKGGGDLYGDLNLRNNFITIGNISQLPQASETYRGKLILIKNNTDGDKLYACLKTNNNNYNWVDWNELSTSIPILTSDPSSPTNGQMWIRSDL